MPGGAWKGPGGMKKMSEWTETRILEMTLSSKNKTCRSRRASKSRSVNVIYRYIYVYRYTEI